MRHIATCVAVHDDSSSKSSRSESSSEVCTRACEICKGLLDSKISSHVPSCATGNGTMETGKTVGTTTGACHTPKFGQRGQLLQLAGSSPSFRLSRARWVASVQCSLQGPARSLHFLTPKAPHTLQHMIPLWE